MITFDAIADIRWNEDLELNGYRYDAGIIMGTMDTLPVGWCSYANTRKERIGKTALHLNVIDTYNGYEPIAGQLKYDTCLVIDVVDRMVKAAYIKAYQVISSCGVVHYVYANDLYFDDET